MKSTNENSGSVSGSIELMKDVQSYLQLKNITNLLNEITARAEKQEFLISVVGEFNRGKSTLINAMIGADILPSGITPTTAHLHIIRHGEIPKISFQYQDFTSEDVNYSKDILAKYTAGAAVKGRKIKYIEVFYPAQFLENGNIIIDTPGVNDIDEQRLEITYGFIPLSDAVIFLFDASTPFKITEKEFLKEKILANNIKKIFFVVNKIDGMTEEEIAEAIGYFNKQLAEVVRIPEIKTFPLSAKFALEERLNKKKNIVSGSGIENFELQFGQFLLSDNRAKVKSQKLIDDLKTVKTLMISDIGAELLQINMSISELTKLKIALHDNKADHQKLFKDLCKYSDEQKERIKSKIELPLLKLYKNIQEELLFTVEHSEQDFSKFAEEEIPRKINSTLKKWVEQSEQSIENMLQDTTQQITTAFGSHFSKFPIMESAFHLMNINEERLRKGLKLDDQKKFSNYNKVTFIGGALLAGLTVYFSGGTAYPVLMSLIGGGGVSQRFIGQRLIKKEINNQKKLLNEEIPNILKRHFLKILEKINGFVDEHFDTLNGNMKKEYEKSYIELEEMIRQRIVNFEKEESSIKERKEVLEKAQSRLLNIMGEEKNG